MSKSPKVDVLEFSPAVQGERGNRMGDDLPNLLGEIVGENLSGVTFVQDYIQLQFNPPPILNIYSRCYIHVRSQRIEFGDAAFAHAMIAQINKVLKTITERKGECLLLVFEDETSIEISLRPEDRITEMTGELIPREHDSGWVVF